MRNRARRLLAVGAAVAMAAGELATGLFTPTALNVSNTGSIHVTTFGAQLVHVA